MTHEMNFVKKTEFDNDVSEIKSSVVDFCDRQEKKLNQLWTAVGRTGIVVSDVATVKNDPELRGFMKTGFQTKALSSGDDSGAFLLSRPVQEHI